MNDAEAFLAKLKTLSKNNLSACEEAKSLFVYTSLGAIITLWGQLAGTWSVLGWSNVGSYLIFVVGYGFFLFVRPTRRE